MRSTEDPVTYAFSHTEAKKIIYALASSAEPYESLRNEFKVSSESFHRITRKLAQFDILRFRAPRSSEFEGSRIKVVMELSTRGKDIASLLKKLDDVIRKNPELVGTRTERLLLEGLD
jgi:hypothetical protein